jgi:hypothetical protein
MPVMGGKRDGEMPKEHISSSGGNFDVEVLWGKGEESGGQEVRVGVTTKNFDKSLVDQLYGDPETLARIGRAVLDANLSDLSTRDVGARILGIVSSGGHGPREFGYNSVFSVLNWPELNRVIRVLKRGRDMAFGKPA